MKNGSQDLIYWKKNLTVILAYFGLIFAVDLSHGWQNCNYSRTNEASGLRFSEKV